MAGVARVGWREHEEARQWRNTGGAKEGPDYGRRRPPGGSPPLSKRSPTGWRSLSGRTALRRWRWWGTSRASWTPGAPAPRGSTSASARCGRAAPRARRRGRPGCAPAHAADATGADHLAAAVVPLPALSERLEPQRPDAAPRRLGTHQRWAAPLGGRAGRGAHVRRSPGAAVRPHRGACAEETLRTHLLSRRPIPSPCLPPPRLARTASFRIPTFIGHTPPPPGSTRPPSRERFPRRRWGWTPVARGPPTRRVHCLPWQPSLRNLAAAARWRRSISRR